MYRIRAFTSLVMEASDLDLAEPPEDPVLEEWRELRARVERQRDRADRMRALADQLQHRAAEGERLLEEMESLLGVSAQLALETLTEELRGRRLLEVATRLLAAELEPGEAIHYRDWYERLCQRGHRVSGRDPLANFLAHISKAPEVEGVGSRTGLYRLAS